VFFVHDQSIGTYSLDPLFLTLGEFQAWDWLWYALLWWSQSRGAQVRTVHGAEISIQISAITAIVEGHYISLSRV